MGVLELEFGTIIKRAIETGKIEPLMRKMALIIDRQAIALGSSEFNMNYIQKASKVHEELYAEMKVLAQEGKGTP